MLPTVQYLLMAIYCIILSPQHKRHSVSVSVCQVGLRKTAPSPWSRQNSSDGSLSQNVHNVHHPPQGRRCDVPLGATVCMSVSVCVNMCVCVFPCLCLYILSVNRVASSCPWVSIDRECGICWVFLSISLCVWEQVEALWATTRSHGDKSRRYAAICSLFGPNVEVWVPILQKHSKWW